MAVRVIQGYFIGGAFPPQPVQRSSAAEARPRRPTGAPPPAFAGRTAPLQARLAPGRPQLAHQGAGPVAQPHGGNGSFEIDPVQLGLARGGGKPLPQAVLAKMEAAFGADFSSVRVHVGPQASRIGAIAFATGDDLYFAPGRFQPDSVQGQQLIGHELAHVVQQRQGRVRAPTSGVAIVQDRLLEAEADRLGMRAALQRTPVQARMLPGPRTAVAGSSRSVQRLVLHNGGLVSRFDRSKMISWDQAVITARSGDSFTGGHASVYLEYLGAKNEGQMSRIDLFYDEADNSIIVKTWEVAHEYNPSNPLTRMMFSRSIVDDLPDKIVTTGQCQSYAIRRNGVQKAFAKAAEIKSAGAKKKISYIKTGGLLYNWTVGWAFGDQRMNCADFAAEIMSAAGAPVTSGLFNRPSAVSAQDGRTNEEIYRGAQALEMV